MWYRPGGIKDRITGNVFVKNLPADFKSHDLYELFLSFGKIFSCRVKYDGAGRCKGYGYVQFETKESADKALAEGGQKVVKDAKIEVCPFKQRESRNSSITMYNNLFVKCIPKKFTNDDLNKMFSPFGEIVSAVVIKDRNESTENRGFGFVCFKKNEDAKTAEEKLKNFQIEGQTLYVCRALPLEEHRRKMREDRLKTFKDCNLYVKPLPEDIDDQGLKKAFEAFGRVLSARVMVERVQDQAAGKVQVKSKGFGFVCLSTKEEAKNAMMAAANGQQILGRTMYVGIAEKKEERMAKFAQGMFPPMYGMPPPMFHGQPPRHRRPYVRFIRSLMWDLGGKTQTHGKALYARPRPDVPVHDANDETAHGDAYANADADGHAAYGSDAVPAACAGGRPGTHPIRGGSSSSRQGAAR